MKTHSAMTGSPTTNSYISETSRVYAEGIVAGLIGAATIAVWFLIWDTIHGQPLYTPMLLGSALFRRSEALSGSQGLRVSMEMVLMYTWVHGLVFCVIGGLASRLLVLAEKETHLGFGILLLLVVLELGFVVAAFMFAEPILHNLAWGAVMVGNLLAAAAMGGYFWRRHSNLIIAP